MSSLSAHSTAGAFAKSTIFLFVLQWVTLIAIFGSLLFFTNEDRVAAVSIRQSPLDFFGQGLTGWSVVNFSDNFAPLFSNTGSGYASDHLEHPHLSQAIMIHFKVFSQCFSLLPRVLWQVFTICFCLDLWLSFLSR